MSPVPCSLFPLHRSLRRASHLMVYVVLGLMAFFTEWEFFGKFTPVDAALGVAAGLWGLAAALDWKAFAPSLRGLGRYWPMGLYALWTLVAACFAKEKGLALVKVVQTLEYFVVAVVLLHDFFAADKRRVRRAAWVVLAVFAVFLARAAAQYWGDADTFGVRGFFKHRNVFAGLVALLAPACFGVMCGARRWWAKAGLAALVALALVVTLSGAAYVAVLLAVAGLAALRGARCFAVTCAAVTLWQTVALDTLAERGWLRGNVTEHVASAALYEDDGRPTPRYPEWQAAAWLITDHPATGVGPGHYQRSIGPYFGVVPRSARDKDESDVAIQNQYLVLAADLGLPGLLLFLAMLATAVRSAARAAFEPFLARGLAAGVLAFAAVLVWHPLLVRGVGLVFVAMLAACHALDAQGPEQGKE